MQLPARPRIPLCIFGTASSTSALSSFVHLHTPPAAIPAVWEIRIAPPTLFYAAPLNPLYFSILNSLLLYVHTPRDMPYDDVELTTKDGVKLRCYLIRVRARARSGEGEGEVGEGGVDDCGGDASSARGTVILFHGNAMNHGHILPYAERLHRRGFNVFTLEYRGYGHSEGMPSEKGLCYDAQAAVDYILADPELSQLPLIIYGQSLGGAVAIHAAYKNSDKIAALIIENTFTSIPDVVKKLPVLHRFSFLCTQRWRSLDKMAKLPPNIPVLMLSGSQDQVIPASHMGRLWEASKARGDVKKKTKKTKRWWCWVQRKKDMELVASDAEAEEKEGGEQRPRRKDKFKVFERGSHNNTCDQPGYWRSVYKFLDNVFGPAP